MGVEKIEPSSLLVEMRPDLDRVLHLLPENELL